MIVYFHDVVFHKIFSSALAYTSQPYAEAMAMRPSVSCITYAIHSKEQTGYIITFTQFVEGYLLLETSYDFESSNESDDDSILAPLISEKKDAMSSGDESDAEPMSMDMLEDIRDGIQSHPIVNRREKRYRIRDN